MDKQARVHLNDGNPLSNKKELTSDTCNDKDESQKDYTKERI